MAGFTVNGVDLDTLFEPIGSTAKRADVGYTIAGSDISNFYADASLGTPYGTTNFNSNSTDIGQLFAATGSLGPPKLFVYTWGRNNQGQLGYLTTTQSWSVISAGDHVGAIRSDGLLFTWGTGGAGRLGLGDTFARSSPTQVGSSSWTAVSSSQNHMAAIRQDGALFTWGYGAQGRLGNLATTNRSSPVQIGSSSWVAVKAGDGGQTLAIRSDGALFAWGAGSLGRLGVGLGNTGTINRSSPVQVGSSSWTSIGAGVLHSGAIRTDGALFLWGGSTDGQNAVNTVTYSWTALSFGGFHTAAIRNDNTLWTWGYNSNGRLGNDDTLNRSIPIQVGTSSWTSVSAGPGHTAAIRSDGALFVWGIGSSGRLGLATTAGANTINRSSPVQVGTSSWTAVSVNNFHSIAILSGGTLFAWGSGANAQTGLNDTIDRSSPVQVGTSNWTSISAGYFHSAAIRTDGGLFTWGLGSSGRLGLNDTLTRSNPTQVGTSSWTLVSAGGVHTAAIRNDGGLFTWGLGSSGRLGIGVGGTGTINRSNPTQVGTSSWTSVSAGAAHTVAILQDGGLYTWGAGIGGSLGNNSVINRSSPVQIGTGSWISISAGASSSGTGAITNTNMAFMWGYGSSGRLGIASTLNFSSPVMVGNNPIEVLTPVQVGSGSWTALSLGFYHTTAITNNSSLFSWGRGTSGRLGLGDTVSRSSPVQVGTSSWTAISAGNSSSAGILDNGGLYTWGSGTQGQLGLNDTFARSSPTQVGTGTWTKVATGTFSTHATTNTNLLYSLGGIGNDGRLGLGNPIIDRSSPVLVGNNPSNEQFSPVQIITNSWNMISAGQLHSAAIRSDGLLFTWGAGSSGRLGLGDTDIRYSPTQVGTSSWTMVSAGFTHTAAIRSDGALFTWGAGSYGRLGDGVGGITGGIERSSPNQIGTSSWTSVSAGGGQTAAIRSDGALFTWGNGNGGRLGLATTAASNTVNRSSPVQVGTSSWTSVSVGGYVMGAISQNGKLFTWGGGGPLGVTALSSWSIISAGYIGNTLAIRTDGALFAWGNNAYGKLGIGDTINRSFPVQIGTSSWTTVSAGGSHSAAVRSDGALFTWGNGSVGQLGLATTAGANTINRSSPVQVGTSSWTSVAAGRLFTMAIRNDGGIFSWGQGSDGQLGQGGVFLLSSPQQVGSSSWSAIAAGIDHSLAIRTDGALFTWGQGQAMPNLTGATESSPVFVGSVGDSWISISAGSRFSLGIKSNYSLWAWADNASGQLGTGNTTGINSIVQIGTSSWTAVGAGNLHSMAIRSDGALFAWGLGSYGRLGIATTASANTINRSSPVQVGSSSWTSLGLNISGHSMAIASDGLLYAWGAGSSGRLGLENTLSRSNPAVVGNFLIPRSSPTQIGNSSWTVINVGYFSAGAIRSDGALFTWGVGTYGRLGTGDQISRSSPTQIGSSSWTAVSMGSTHAAAVRSDGALFTWGVGSYGRLGLGTTASANTINRSSPVIVGTYSWTQVDAGDQHTIGLSKYNSLPSVYEFPWIQLVFDIYPAGAGQLNTSTELAQTKVFGED